MTAAGGSQACGEGRGEGDGGAAESCVRDAGGAAVAAVVESFAGPLGGEAGLINNPDLKIAATPPPLPVVLGT